MGFEKALGEVKVIKDQIQYRSQSLLDLARGYFSVKVSSQSRKSEFRVFSIVHLNIDNF